MIKVSSSAYNHFLKLLSSQKENTHIRISISNPGTEYAKCSVCYCFPEDFISSDIIVKFKKLLFRINPSIAMFLKDTKIDIIQDQDSLISQLTIMAPHAKISYEDAIKNPKLSVSMSLFDKIKYVLFFQINPQLSMHGGQVSLIKVTKDSLVLLELSGSCNGCAMSSYTMLMGIEKTLKEMFPQIKEVRDITQHQRGTHSYY